MEDMDSIGAIDIGSGVIVNCDEERYIGYLMGSDEVYLHLKKTHNWVEVNPVVDEESKIKLQGILANRPTWMLLAQVAWRYKMLTFGMDRATAMSLMQSYIENEAIYESGPFETFVAVSSPITVNIPHYRIGTVENLAEVMQSNVLSDLDFAPSFEYTDTHGDREEVQGEDSSSESGEGETD